MQQLPNGDVSNESKAHNEANESKKKAAKDLKKISNWRIKVKDKESQNGNQGTLHHYIYHFMGQ